MSKNKKLDNLNHNLNFRERSDSGVGTAPASPLRKKGAGIFKIIRERSSSESDSFNIKKDRKSEDIGREIDEQLEELKRVQHKKFLKEKLMKTGYLNTKILEEMSVKDLEESLKQEEEYENQSFIVQRSSSLGSKPKPGSKPITMLNSPLSINSQELGKFLS